MKPRITFNLLGPQGSGKGTQAKILTDKFGFFLFDAGESLRQIRATGTPLGEKIASYIDAGKRVPPTLLADVTYERLKSVPEDQDILFDGLLRSLEELEVQRSVFERLNLALPVIVFLNVDQETALSRIAHRRICSKCGARYIVSASEPLTTCKKCGGTLTMRHDDTPEAIKERLAWYYRDTVPVIDYFRAHGTVIDIDASPTIEEVGKDILAKVGAYYEKAKQMEPV